jgi:hypothetical protein
VATAVHVPGSPWHEGEIALRKSAGLGAHLASVGQGLVQDHLTDDFGRFYATLPFVVLGAVDASGDAWGTIRCGAPGFLAAPDVRHLLVKTPTDPHDPVEGAIIDGSAVAVLGIDLRTRHRARLNGTVRARDNDGFQVEAEHSFINCPQYIQLRDHTFVRDPKTLSCSAPEAGFGLDERARDVIRAADTFFVVSYVEFGDAHRQVDASHRGGRSGFVRIDGDDLLTIPDFAGNTLFNTLGNLLVNPRCGMVFVDFATGDLLQLTGDATIVLDSPEIAAFQGADRLWTFRPRKRVFRRQALPLRWNLEGDGWSPNSLLTGTWTESAQRVKVFALGLDWRPLSVHKIIDESEIVRSFYLEPIDGAGLIAHKPGQHLPLRVTLPEETAPILRTYTLSAAPSDPSYRISVKREGRVSTYLHDHIQVGDLIETRVPAGGFTIDTSSHRPAVLLAAGVGITPMIAMLRAIVYEGQRTRQTRPTYLFYGARRKTERAFDDEISECVKQGQGQVIVVRMLSDGTGAKERVDYDLVGRIDLFILQSYLPFGDYDFYLCGPPGFMQDLYDQLRSENVPDDRIHAEAFGPAGVRRDAAVAGPPPAAEAVEVTFLRTCKAATWTPDSGSLLELAEQSGLKPLYSCRAGNCGTCQVTIKQGTLFYTLAPAAEVAPGKVLICCSLPAAGSPPIRLDL